MRHVCRSIIVAATLLSGLFSLSARDLTNTSTEYYAGSGVCALCQNSLRNLAGDVSIAADWESTMMANASNDPLWQTKVYSETVRNPAVADFIENKCAICPEQKALLLFQTVRGDWHHGLPFLNIFLSVETW